MFSRIKSIRTFSLKNHETALKFPRLINCLILFQEAARLHREHTGWSPTVGKYPEPSPSTSVSRWSTPEGSSRESSLDPTTIRTPATVIGRTTPRNIVLHRIPSGSEAVSGGGSGFGFTLRHFIVYPPEDGSGFPPATVAEGQLHYGNNDGLDLQSLKEPMDTIFVKSVKHGSPAHLSGLCIGKEGVLTFFIKGVSFNFTLEGVLIKFLMTNNSMCPNKSITVYGGNFFSQGVVTTLGKFQYPPSYRAELQDSCGL